MNDDEELKERIDKLEATVVLLTHTVFQLAEGDEGPWWVKRGLEKPTGEQIEEAQDKLGWYRDPYSGDWKNREED